jgi:hypothetical protein
MGWLIIPNSKAEPCEVKDLLLIVYFVDTRALFTAEAENSAQLLYPVAG